MPTINVTRSIHIDAHPKKIYPSISNLSNWQKWSPWVIAEPNVKIKLTSDGNYYEWEGDIIGAGNLKIFDREVNKSVQMHLSFLKPWKSKATTTFHLKPTPKGTTLTWTMKSKLPFFMTWMKRQMEDFIGMDYDRGLNMLKDFIETGNTNSSLEFKGQKKLYPLQYVGLKRICPINEIGQNMEQDFTYLLDFLRENYSDQLKGKPMSIYHQWKINKNRVSYTACHPITEIPTTLPKPFFTRKIPQTKVYTVRHIGPYRHIGNAWATAMVHQRAKLFKPRKGIPPMEVMINSPKETPENELIAEVLFPMK